MGQDRDVDFEDDRGVLNRETRMRRHVLKVYNKRRDDFPDDRAYDDYLEEVEDVIFNMVYEVDVEKTKARFETYRRQNQELIGQNHARRVEEDRRAAEMLAHVERAQATRLASLRRADAEMEAERRRKRVQEEEEEIRRVALGEKEAARLKRKQEKRERKERRKAEQEEREKKLAAAKAAEPDVAPMFFRPAFPNPPPNPLPPPDKDKADNKTVAKARGAGGGYKHEISYERAALEFSQSLLRAPMS